MAGPARQDVVTDVSEQAVGAGPTREVVVPLPSMELIRPLSTLQGVVAEVAGVEHVVSLPAYDDVIAGVIDNAAAPEHTTIEQIIARPTIYMVVTGVALDRVFARSTAEHVVPPQADDRVVALPAVDH